MKKLLFLALCLLFIIISLSGCKISDADIDKTVEFFQKKISSLSQTLETDEDLTEAKIYERINNNLADYVLKTTFKNVKQEDIEKAYLQVVEEHPEYFWVSDGYIIDTATSWTGDVINITAITDWDIDELDSKKEKLNKKVSEILSLANEYKSDYKKALFVHDYLVDNTVYDTATADKILKDTENNKIYNSSTAYGCLVDGKAICSGYSAAFHLLMNRIGIECGKVLGDIIDGERHQWNYIALEDKYYYVDVTWDDPLFEDKTNSKSREFFCITTSELERTHIIDKDNIFIPQCVATKYNYFKYTKTYVDIYSFEKVAEIINNNSSLAELEIKFASEKALNNAFDEFITNGRIFELSSMSQVENIQYIISESGVVLTLILK